MCVLFGYLSYCTIKLKYILLSKFQRDNLEERFGLYRQLSGCNYLVSVQEVFQSERKLKIKGLLRLYTSKGVIPISDFIASFSEIIKFNKMRYLLKNFHIVTWTQKYRTYQNCYVSPDL